MTSCWKIEEQTWAPGSNQETSSNFKKVIFDSEQGHRTRFWKDDADTYFLLVDGWVSKGMKFSIPHH